MHARTVVASTVLAAIAALGLAACGGSDTAGSDPDTFVASIGLGEPLHLVPSDSGETEGHQVIEALYTPLVEFDEKFRPIMSAAESSRVPAGIAM